MNPPSFIDPPTGCCAFYKRTFSRPLVVQVVYLPNACWCICLSSCLKVSEHLLFFLFCTDRLVDSDYTVQTDRHTSCTYARTRTDLQTGRSARGYLKWGAVGFVCALRVGGIWGVLINCTDVDFLSQSHVSLNNLHIKYPPLVPPKAITGTRRRGAPVHVDVCVD